MASLAIGMVTALCAGGLSLVYNEKIHTATKSVVKWIATNSFYVGFKELEPSIALARRQELLTTYGAKEFKCKNNEGAEIDAIYVPSPSKLRTGNVLVQCLNTTYQDHHPSHWKTFLENGADILLWNPTKLGSVSYSKDLSAVLRALRMKDPNQVIALKTYCASTDPGIKAAAEQNDEKIHIIVDRGHGDVQKLARSFTIFAQLPVVQTVLQEEFSCGGIHKIKEVSGKALFLTAQLDQVMDYGKKRNFTRDLHFSKSEHPLIELESQDHWSNWDYSTYNKVLGFLAQLGVVSPRYLVNDTQFPKMPPPTCFKRKCLPVLTKTCL